MNCLSFYCFGTLLFALGLIEVVLAVTSYKVNSVDLGGRRFGLGVIKLLKDSEPRRFAYAEDIAGSRRPAITKAVYDFVDIMYYEVAENNSIKFQHRTGTMNIINFANVTDRTNAEADFKSLDVPCKIDGVITPNPSND